MIGFSYEYNGLGAVTKRQGERGFCEQVGYDDCGRLTRQVAGRAGIDGAAGGGMARARR